MDSQTNNTAPDGGRPPHDDDPAAFLERLLARDEGIAARTAAGDGIGDALMVRLSTALMHRTELHAMRQRKGRDGPVGHRVLRHVFLLTDGGYAALWEVEYATRAEGPTVHRLFAGRRQAEAYVRETFGEPPLLDLWPRLGDRDGGQQEPPDSLLGPVLGAGPEADRRDVMGGPQRYLDLVAGTADALDPEGEWGDEPEPGVELGRMIAEIFFTARRAEQSRSRRARHSRHVYRTDDAAEHARRLLRRAQNGDRPGDAVRRMLARAVGHETTLVTLRHDATDDGVTERALYEHAFLLEEGGELSLWELETTSTPGGQPVCEVHLDEAAARDSADRHRAGS